jgi:hypothetical protein
MPGVETWPGAARLNQTHAALANKMLRKRITFVCGRIALLYQGFLELVGSL